MVINTIGNTDDVGGRVPPKSEGDTLAETSKEGQNLTQRSIRDVISLHVPMISYSLEYPNPPTMYIANQTNNNKNAHDKSIKGKEKIGDYYVVYKEGDEYIPIDSSYARDLDNNKKANIVDLYRNGQRFHVVEGTYEEEISGKQKYMVIIESNEGVKYTALSK